MLKSFNSEIVAPDVDYLINGENVGRPLIISFSFAFWERPCEFDFIGRFKKIEGLYDQPFNSIFLRDRHSLWYHRGVNGLGNNIGDVVAFLKLKIEHLQPSMIVTIGQSMGGYAALIFGALLKADKIISFAPLSFIDPEKLNFFGDRRYYQALKKINDIKLDVKYLDVLEVFSSVKHDPEIHVVFGVDGDSDRELVHMDSMHALRLQALPGCVLHALEGVGHLVVKHLADNEMMDSFLLKHIFNYEIGEKSLSNDIEFGWYKWIFDNTIAGAPIESLRVAIENSGSENKAALIEELKRAGNDPYIRAARELKLELDKRNWLLNTFDSLSALDSRYSEKIESRHVPAFEDFIREYYSKGLPVILKGGVDDWPALKKWGPHYFKTNFGDSLIEVQYGRSNDPSYEKNSLIYKKKMKMGDFCDLVTSCGSSNDFYLTANNNKASHEGLHDLFEDVGDFGIGYRDMRNIASRSHLWFGPKGTITQFHHDLTNNMLVQIYGRKKLILVPAFQVQNMYNDHHVYSAVRFPDVNESFHPKFKKNTFIEVVLEPGDAIFIPIGWWHYVESLDVSISVSFTDFNTNNNFFEFYPR